MKFRIADIMWLTLVVSLWFGWRYDTLKVNRLVDKFDLRTLCNYMDQNGGPDNLHSFQISYGAYYGSKAEMRFAKNETTPVIKEFEMHNENINQNRPKETRWRRTQ